MSNPTKTLKGAVIGYGFISSKGHLPAYAERSDIQIVAIADTCAARRQIAQEVIKGARIYDSAEALFAGEKDLDFVDISTPPCDHFRIASLALSRGLHVLCEKPLTTTLEDARALLALANEKKRVLFPCHNYKHAPVVKEIRKIIDSGVLGTVHSLTLTTFRNTHAKGVNEWHTHWRRERKYSGGGIAMDHGSHTFYLTFDWLGGYPTAVTAKMSNSTPEKYDTEDSFSCVLTFPQGYAHAHLTWTAGVRKVMYSVQGSKGAITVDDDNLEISKMVATQGPDVAQGAVRWETEKRSIASHWMDASHVTWFNSLLDQFKGAMARGEWVGKEAKEAFRCIEIIDTAYRSSTEGCRELPLKGLEA